MTTRMAFINQKGGVGKTTLSANCGAYWARERRVLAIDLDPQANLSVHFGAGEECEEKNIYRVLRGDYDLGDAGIGTDEGLDLVPSHIDLSAAEWELGQEVGREVILKEQLDSFLAEQPYDVVIIDCPPSLGFLSLNALAAVDDVVIPVQAEFFALQGMAQLLKVLQLVQKRLHPRLRWPAIVPTLVDVRTNLGREVIEELHEHFAEQVTECCISKRVKIAEAPGFGQSIFSYAPESASAEELASLAIELEERLAMAPAASPRSR